MTVQHDDDVIKHHDAETFRVAKELMLLSHISTLEENEIIQFHTSSNSNCSSPTTPRDMTLHVRKNTKSDGKTSRITTFTPPRSLPRKRRTMLKGKNKATPLTLFPSFEIATIKNITTTPEILVQEYLFQHQQKFKQSKRKYIEKQRQTNRYHLQNTYLHEMSLAQYLPLCKDLFHQLSKQAKDI